MRNTSSYYLPALLLSAACATSTQAAIVTLVNDSFENDNSPAKGGASDVAWIANSTDGSVSVVPGTNPDAISGATLRFATTTNNKSMSAYFSSTTLGVGESIQLSLSLRSTGTTSAAQGLRIALLNSAGTKTSNANGDDDGYGLGINPGASSTNGGDINFFANGSPTSVSGAKFNTNAPGGINTMTLTITKATDGSLDLVGTSDLFNTTNNTVSANIPTPLTSTFDEIYVRFSGSGVQGPVYLDNVVVSYVPEPAALALFGLTGLCGLRRRRA